MEGDVHVDQDAAICMAMRVTGEFVVGDTLSLGWLDTSLVSSFYFNVSGDASIGSVSCSAASSCGGVAFVNVGG